jgi:uncharacterized protein (DUF488 family)
VPPKQQRLNRIEWNAQRSLADADFFTIGYSGRTTTEFLDALDCAEVATLVDVRANPVSLYKPDFSRSNLSRLLADRDISYVHRPELGVPRDVRGLAVVQATLKLVWDWYEESVARPFAANLDWFVNGLEHPVALMCTEVDPQSCHRHVLTLALEAKRLRGYEL